ncbi:hypothetical protein TWF696_006989 [Orbilia brochopaga]|uniref:Uncharacterized protein n=1 Tax=Orbilia brochopaga TaxID=3140254 RepID=A0AAV9UTV7_9PEZI
MTRWKPSSDSRSSPSTEPRSKIARAFDWIIPGRKRKPPVTPSFRVIRITDGYGKVIAAGDPPVVLPPVVAPVAATPVAPVMPAGPASRGILGGLFNTEAEKMRVLEESTKDVPRYLFRACSPSSGGGFKGLNTLNGVFPHAFVDANGKKIENGGHKSIHELGHATTRKMAMGHLSGQRPSRTDAAYSQFSSWAASLALVLQYGHGRALAGGLICILDRYNLPKNTKVYHCPSMMKAGLCDSPYDHEYLVHGPVEGPGFKAVPVQRLIDLGVYVEIPCVLPQSVRYWWGPTVQSEWERIFVAKAFTETQVKKLRKAAEEFGKDFTIPMLAAMLTLERRRIEKDGKFNEKDVKIFADVVADLYVPEEYGTENSFVQPAGIYVTGYPMVAQLAALFKGLVEYNYGRGARARRRVKLEDLAAEVGALGLLASASADSAIEPVKPGRMSTHIEIGVSDVVY